MRSLLVFLALVGSASAQTGYTGQWYRDVDRSDDPDPILQSAVSGFVSKNSRGRASASDMDPQYLKRLNQVLTSYLQYADELYLELDDRELVVDDGGDIMRIYYLDGEKHERQMRSGTRMETVASRSAGKIHVAMKTEHDAKIYETYELSSSGDELVLTVRLEDKQLKKPLVIRTIYTRE